MQPPKSTSMPEDNFAFIIHPIDPKRDVGRKHPALGKLPVWMIDYLSLFFPPVFISNISGVCSEGNGRFLEGWFIACPLTPTRMMRLPPTVVYKKIVQTGRLAEKLGAKILGLGAFTAVVGDGGVTIAKHLNLPVTTGDSYTVAIAIQAIHEAAHQLNNPLKQSTVAILGATGSIGAVCAQLLADECAHLILIGRQEDKLQQLFQTIKTSSKRRITISKDINQLSQAHFVLSVSSAVDTIIKSHHIRPGAVVCDVARPRDVSRAVVAQRPDVLVIEGGMVEVPGPVDFGFDFGFPPKMAYACMAETMALALEQRYESFTLGKEIKLSQVMTIDKIAQAHGFKLGGFRSFEKAISAADIARVKSYGQKDMPPPTSTTNSQTLSNNSSTLVESKGRSS